MKSTWPSHSCIWFSVQRKEVAFQSMRETHIVSLIQATYNTEAYLFCYFCCVERIDCWYILLLIRKKKKCCEIVNCI